MDLTATTRPAYAPEVELVERKGAGHPDTVCDALAEWTAVRIARHFLAATGALRHFNVDKAVLAAGAVEVGFGGGRVIRPARVVLVGKADLRSSPPDEDALAAGAAEELCRILPQARPDAFDVRLWLSPSAVDLVSVLSGRGDRAPLANDTSFAVVSLPRSPLEEAVHEVERSLTGGAFRAVVPIGRDVKVMGYRAGERVSMTVAAAVLAEGVAAAAAYADVVTAVRDEATRVAADVLGTPVEVAVNQADTPETPYLTLSGSSGEAGDDGQVGRGNRFGGLITPYRPMSLEACAGKNPAAHVGKTYHAVAHDIAVALLAAGAGEATVRLLSRIGTPVNRPWAVAVETVRALPRRVVVASVEEALSDWRGVTERLLGGAYELF